MFRLTFLGTSSGIPTKDRNVSALAVEWAINDTQKCGDWLLVDCGEGTQHQLMKTPLQLKKLKAILITHLHGDHCFGLAGLLSSLAMHGRSEPLTIIASKGLIKLLDTYSLVNELYFTYPIDFKDIESFLSDKITLNFGKELTMSVETAELSHRMPSYAFALTVTIDKQKLDGERLTALNIDKKDWGQAIKDDPSLVVTQTNRQKIVIAGDNDTPSLLSDLVVGAMALVHECTYTQSVLDKILAKGVFDPKHTTARAIGEFAQMAKLPCLILTHFSARFSLFDNPASDTPNMGHIRTEVQTHYRGKLYLAEDFMQIVI
ncbi:MAG: ribonuclease Z [Moraxella sp.]|uniref:ribonuclease Z n=1 Tax=Moraxella sp. TaxID=479 RepID=UPI0026DD94D7|nr:ribonuclease Z [Moraxella sp.]MDO4450734.1 ribonuclease Z [Moraxella sp.]